jgi:hypothetical protein
LFLTVWRTSPIIAIKKNNNPHSIILFYCLARFARIARIAYKKDWQPASYLFFYVWRSLRSHSYKKDWQPASYLFFDVWRSLRSHSYKKDWQPA